MSKSPEQKLYEAIQGSVPEGLVKQPPNTNKRTEVVYAFLGVDEDGNEGVMATQAGPTMLPLIAFDEARLKDIRSLASKVMANATDGPKKVKLVRFSHREDLEEYGEVT